jgi:hypothetical protein
MMETTMKYLLALFADESLFPTDPDEVSADLQRWAAHTEELIEAGVFVAGEGLDSAATAHTVRVSAGRPHPVTDGPFSEAKEQLGGFYLVECASQAEALEWAQRVPLPEGASIEVRPVVDYSQLP